MRKNQNPPMRIKKGDVVQVIAGNYRGKKGKVLKVFPDERRVIVEGANFIQRHTRPTQTNQQGGIQEREAPIDISNVMLVCPKCGANTRIGMHHMEDGSKNRVCKKCREMIDA